jgi:hypothetical protein
LVVEAVEDGLFVVDEKRNTAHYLQRPAAFVWQHCDGERSVEELAELLRERLDIEAAPEVVQASLDLLGKAQLLEAWPVQTTAQTRLARRRLLRIASLVPAALVMSISLPSATRAQSGGEG